MSDAVDLQISHSPERSRYEAVLDGERAVAAYEMAGDTMTMTHTVVPAALEGHGVGAALVRHALDDARARGLRVVPRCVFVRAFMRRHPEYQALVPDESRALLDPDARRAPRTAGPSADEAS